MKKEQKNMCKIFIHDMEDITFTLWLEMIDEDGQIYGFKEFAVYDKNQSIGEVFKSLKKFSIRIEKEARKKYKNAREFNSNKILNFVRCHYIDSDRSGCYDLEADVPIYSYKDLLESMQKKITERIAEENKKEKDKIWQLLQHVH